MRLRTPLAVAGIALALALPGARHAGSPAAAASASSDLFGVVGNGDPQALKTIGITWYLTGDATPGVVAGMNRVSVIKLNPPPDQAAILAAVASRPGSAWVIGNEPNVPTVSTSDATSPEDYATELHDWEAAIHGVDPTAIIVGPNVLNWADTCQGCGDNPFPSGEAWTKEFYQAYTSTYGVRPPVDRWGIHSYELNWVDLPTLHTDHHKRQITGFRNWLDSIPDEAGRPIWITEMGFHWAFSGLTIQNGKAVPVGSYEDSGVTAWLDDLTSWLEADGVQMNVERTFFFAQTASYEGFSDTYGGLSFFATPLPNSALTPAGLEFSNVVAGP